MKDKVSRTRAGRNRHVTLHMPCAEQRRAWGLFFCCPEMMMETSWGKVAESVVFFGGGLV